MQHIHGDGVNVAAHLAALCEPGCIAISGNVHEQVQGKTDVQFIDDGIHEVKNIAGPVQVWRWSEAANAKSTVTDHEPQHSDRRRLARDQHLLSGGD